MRVRRISVRGLFGVFHHDIPLNMNDRITIIHGLNGYGKTIILQMVHGVLRGEYTVLRKVPFERFDITFDDDSVLRVAQMLRAGGDPADPKGLDFTLTRPGEPSESFDSYPGEREQHDQPHQPSLLRLLLKGSDPGTASKEPDPGQDGQGARETAWLEHLRDAVPVKIIQTQRLALTSPANRAADDIWLYGAPSPELAVDKYSEDLASRIQATLAKYAARSQELDRTFPTRLFQHVQAIPLSFDALQRRLTEIEERRVRLTHIGLLDPEQNLGQVALTEDPTKLGVMSIYVRDVDEKLGVFDKLAAKIGLFMKLVNARFRYKTLSVDREHGLVFTARDGSRLPAAALSSGEQHEIVLLYELIFKVRPNSLILIDEPEISLHLTWQQQFLSDLQQIVQLSHFDVLVATHSADIIGDRWDLTVALQGPAA